MTPTASIFADRLTNITVTGNLIRLEFGTLQPATAEGQQPQLAASQTLVMPLEGFLPSFGMMDTVLKKLTEAGVLKFQPAPDSPTAVQ